MFESRKEMEKWAKLRHKQLNPLQTPPSKIPMPKQTQNKKELTLLEMAQEFKQIIDKLRANGVVLLVEKRDNEMTIVLNKGKEEYRIRGEQVE
ncbi:MAG: hypothetical protein ACLUSV_00680 [Streptococcus sp.]